MYKTPSVRVENVWYQPQRTGKSLAWVWRISRANYPVSTKLVRSLPRIRLEVSRTVYIQINLNHAGQPNQHWCINSSKTISRMPPALKLKAVDNTTEMLFYL